MNNFKFFLPGLVDHIKENDPVWKTLIPMSRKKGEDSCGILITLGEYFKAAEAFLSENNFQRLFSSVYQYSKTSIIPESNGNISVYLEKHGEFYHPSRVEFYTQNQRFEFVLNVAISPTGLKYLECEFDFLKKLRDEYPWDFVPAVYEKGHVNLEKNGPCFGMFLGEWFAGFNEFHIHSPDQDNNCRIEVWDQIKGNYFLAEKQAYELYRQIARILTCYYNPETFERIHLWHHAAGDFVVRPNGNDQILVKLVTVRDYQSLIHNNPKAPGSIYEALTFFLMDLSIKNRIDRFDGVGEFAWADDIYVMATIDGFFKGLHQKIQLNEISKKKVDRFCQYLKSLTRPSTEQFFIDVLSAWPQQIKESEFVVSRISDHVFIFEYFLDRYLSKNSAQ